ncbi:hypothetical protein K523DRAFT_322197 [Schizophyllum commune Tattone D]|nr:hypothetical protein K523DRAFT_322197 [Schizophyllum commune Tattone D]
MVSGEGLHEVGSSSDAVRLREVNGGEFGSGRPAPKTQTRPVVSRWRNRAHKAAGVIRTVFN